MYKDRLQRLGLIWFLANYSINTFNIKLLANFFFCLFHIYFISSLFFLFAGFPQPKLLTLKLLSAYMGIFKKQIIENKNNANLDY